MDDPIRSPELLVGDRAADHLSVRPLRRTHPAATGFWDANWLKAAVTVRAGAFRAAFEADLRSDELEGLEQGLAALEGAPGGTATFASSEGWLAFRLTRDARGRLQAACEVRDDPAGGRCLRFPVRCGDSQRADLLAALRQILAAFPVIGDPGEEGGVLLAGLGDDDAPGDA